MGDLWEAENLCLLFRLLRQRAQTSVVERLKGCEVTIVLIPGTLRARTGVADGVVDQVEDGSPPRRDVVGRSVHHVAVDESDRSRRPDQRFDSVLLCEPLEGGAIDMMQRIPFSLRVFVKLGVEKPVALRTWHDHQR